MKIIGLIGGMSWESSLEYYRIINQEVKRQLGGLHSANCILYSLDFAQIEQLQANGEWDKAGDEMLKAAQALERAGAEVLIICTNTMHKLVNYISERCFLPILHIADAVAETIHRDNISSVALLGTKFTMEQDFYRQHLEQKHSLEVLIPTEIQRNKIHNIIYQELCQGIISPESKAIYLEIIKDLHSRGAQGIILGCTEIELLIEENDYHLARIYPTTRIHAQYAVKQALNKEKI